MDGIFRLGKGMVSAGRAAMAVGLAGFLFFKFLLLFSFPVITIPVAVGYFMCRRSGTAVPEFLVRGRVGKLLSRETGFMDTIFRLSRVILYAMVKAGLCDFKSSATDLLWSMRDDGSMRIFMSTENGSAEFAAGLRDTLAPLQSQKYFLLSPVFTDKEGLWQELYSARCRNGDRAWKRILQTWKRDGACVIPVPEIFGRNKNYLRCFHESWEEEMGPAQLYGSRGREGKEFMKEHFRKSLLDVICSTKEVWQ